MSPGSPEKAGLLPGARAAAPFPLLAEAGKAPPARSATARLRLLMVDDHPVVRRGIGVCLARRPRFEIVGEAGDGEEALRKVKELAPDIVLMDI